nr:hypothetical protein [Tanacetum cinerariifolium]
MGRFANRGKGKQKPNLGGRAAARLNTRDKTQNLSLKEMTDTKGPVLIQFELRDKQTVMPLGDHAAHWSSYIGEVIRGVPLYYPSWLKVQRSGRPRSLQEEIRRLEAMGTYTDDEISRLARGQKQRGYIAGVGMYCRHGPQLAQFNSGGASGSGGCGDEEEGADHQDDEDEDGDGDTYDVFPATSHWEKESPATSRRGSPKMSLEKALNRRFPGDLSPGKPIPSDMSSGNPENIAGERR